MSILDAMNSLRSSQGRAATTNTVVVEADMREYHKKLVKGQRDLAKFDKKLEASRRKAAATTGSGGKGFFARNFRISGEGFAFGAAKMGAEGFTFEKDSALRHARSALVAVAITRSGAAVVSGVNKFNKMRKEGVDLVEAGLRVGRDSAARIGRQVSDATGAVKLMSGIGELLGSGDTESNEKAIFKFYSDFFTTQKEMEEREKKRREFLEEKTEDIEDFLADQLKTLESARPVGFRVRDTAGLIKYRQELKRINARSQALKRDILIEQAEQQSRELEQEGS